MKSRRYVAGPMVATIFLVTLLPAAAQQTTLRIAGNFAAEHTSSKAMETFKSELTRRSNGTLSADLFSGMQLGGAQENVQAVRAGTIFATWIGIAFVSRLVPEVEAVSLPLVFAGGGRAWRVMDGRAGDSIGRRLTGKGLPGFGGVRLGAGQVPNSR